MKNDLKEAYQRWRQRGRGNNLLASAAECFRAPCLAMPPDEWASSKHRILLFGQETRGWDVKDRCVCTLHDFIFSPSDTVDILMDHYATATPEQRSFRIYEKRVGEMARDELNGPTCVITSNVIRCAVGSDDESDKDRFKLGSRELRDWSLEKTGFSDAYRNSYLKFEKGLLSDELNALQPTFVIFVSGPRYDEYIETEFDLTELEKQVASESPYGVRQLAKLINPELSRFKFPMYRTYHPRYISGRTGRLEAIFQDFKTHHLA